MDATQKWFDELYLEHAKKMAAIATYLGLTKEESEDIVQDAFLLLLSKKEKFRDSHSNPAAFLYVTERNLIGDTFRRRKRRQLTAYEDIPERGVNDTYFPALKDNLLPGLSAADQRILIAYYDKQMSYAELSEQLGISEGQCRLKVFRAKNRYKKLLLEETKRDT